MTVSKIRHFQYPHVDDVEISKGIDFDFDVFPEEPTVESDNAYDFEYQKGEDYDHAESPLQEESSKSADDERLWWPLTPEEPVLECWIQFCYQSWMLLQTSLKLRGFKIWMFW